MSEQIELKPCPWCGKSDELEKCGPVAGKTITCWRCVVIGPSEDADAGVSAEEAWNQRPEGGGL